MTIDIETDDVALDGWQVVSDAAHNIDCNPFAEVAALKAIYAHFHDADPRSSFEAYAMGRFVESLLRRRRVDVQALRRTLPPSTTFDGPEAA